MDVNVDDFAYSDILHATWTVVLAGPAEKSLRRVPPRDKERIHAVLKQMEADPFRGPIKYLKGQEGLLRVGSASGASSFAFYRNKSTS